MLSDSSFWIYRTVDDEELIYEVIVYISEKEFLISSKDFYVEWVPIQYTSGFSNEMFPFNRLSKKIETEQKELSYDYVNGAWYVIADLKYKYHI